MKAAVDPVLCTGCGLCTDTCPEVFSMEGDTAVAITTEVPEECTENCQMACDDCPVEAIVVSE